MNIWTVDHRFANDEMRNIIKNIKGENDLYVLAGLIMRAEDRSNNIAGLFNTINNPESLMNLVSVYGGETIKIPTINELMDALKFIKLIYCYDFQFKAFSESMRLAGYDESERDVLLERRKKLLELLGGYYGDTRNG